MNLMNQARHAYLAIILFAMGSLSCVEHPVFSDDADTNSRNTRTQAAFHRNSISQIPAADTSTAVTTVTGSTPIEGAIRAGVNSDCMQSYQRAMNSWFSDSPTLKLQNIDETIRLCYQVGLMQPDRNTFNCQQYSSWFVRCMNDRGHYAKSIGLACHSCKKSCDRDGIIAHAVVLYRRSDGKYCAGEPQLVVGGESSWTCTDSPEATRERAGAAYCAGFWPDTEAGEDPEFEGCRFLRAIEHDDATCAERCRPEHEDAVKELLESRACAEKVPPPN